MAPFYSKKVTARGNPDSKDTDGSGRDCNPYSGRGRWCCSRSQGFKIALGDSLPSSPRITGYAERDPSKLGHQSFA